MRKIDWQSVTELKAQTKPHAQISILQPPSNVAREREERAGETDNVPLLSSDSTYAFYRGYASQKDTAEKQNITGEESEASNERECQKRVGALSLCLSPSQDGPEELGLKGERE